MTRKLVVLAIEVDEKDFNHCSPSCEHLADSWISAGHAHCVLFHDGQGPRDLEIDQTSKPFRAWRCDDCFEAGKLYRETLGQKDGE